MTDNIKVLLESYETMQKIVELQYNMYEKVCACIQVIFVLLFKAMSHSPC